MKRSLAIAALLAGAVCARPAAADQTPSPAPPDSSSAGGSTYLFEWTTRTGAALRRLTLFTDRVLVRKSTGEDGKSEMKKRKLSDDEYAFYEKFLKDSESESAAGNFETGLSGDRSARSVVSVAPPDAAKWSFSFDSFSSLSSAAAGVKAALEGLADSFGKVLPNESDFPVEKLIPGTVLRRRDGQEFRIVHVDEDSKVLEMRAVGQPYSRFFEWKSLRFSFFPP